MAKLTSAERNALPASAFLDPTHRKYPAEDPGHAKAAIARAGEYGHPKLQAKAKAKLRKLT